MKSKASILKWITVAILGLSLVFFFLPYFTAFGESFNPMQLIDVYNTINRIDGVVEMIFFFILPVVLTAVSAFILAFKVGTAKCVVSTILSFLALCVYLLFFNSSLLEISSDNIGIGLVGNIVIACSGIILPIVVLVLHKKEQKQFALLNNTNV